MYNNNTVRLKDGRSLSADLIVGVDGQRSVVRRSIPATASAGLIPFDEKAYRYSVDKATMRSNHNLSWLLDCGTSHIWSMPGKYVLAWPLLPNKAYDVVACVGNEGDGPTGYWGVRADPKTVAVKFDNACPTVRSLLSLIGPCVQRRLTELPPLSTCRSPSGAVVLLGDAWHAIAPARRLRRIRRHRRRRRPR